MIKRQWKGDPSCYFCHLHESTTHLLFTCSVVKTVWATIATCIGATNVPTSFNQSWKWCERWIPRGKQFYAIGIGAVLGNLEDEKQDMFRWEKLNNPLEIISHACALMKFWAGLQKEVDKEALIKGVDTMFKIAVQLLSKKRRADNQSNMLPHATREDDADQELER